MISETAISYIRFSHPNQAAGDSFRRQMSATLDYCAEHNLTLDESFHDLGTSAFRGKHRAGALGRFLERLDPKHPSPIPRNRVFLIDAMDRLSREEVIDALSVFLDIIRAGVAIVTLADGQRYDRASLISNVGQIFLSIGLMIGANAESKNKAIRVKASWISRRKSVTRVTPGWITVIDRQHTIRPECLPVIQFIFESCVNGLGHEKIAATLNERGIQPFANKKRKTEGWYPTYIRSMIKSRAVLGEIEEREIIDGKSVPTGRWIDPPPYPPAISVELWQQANDALASRRHTAGRKGETFPNLLQGLAICTCGASMRLRIRGNRWNYAYFRCSAAARSKCDHRTYVNYRTVEAHVLKNFGMVAHGLDRPVDHSPALVLISEKRTEAERTLATVNRLLDFGQVGVITAKRIADMEQRHAALLQEIVQLERNMGRQERARPLDEEIAAIRQLIGDMDQLEAAERYAIRAKINQGLKVIFRAITINGDGQVVFHLDERRLSF